MGNDSYLRSVKRAASYIRSSAPSSRTPRVAVVLGSGLAGSIPDLKKTRTIPYKDIPGFPRITVSGHSGRLLLGEHSHRGRRLDVAVLEGRFHYYEGHSMSEITLPVRALRSLGLETLVLTSAVGSMRKALRPGHICVVKDHMNFMGQNPLRGRHTAEYGAMFPDLVGAYTPELRKLALAECRRLRMPAREGVYAAAPGASYETPAEIRAYRQLGGDVVGMSVVPEAIVARQIGLRLLCLSWVANMAAGISREALAHHDVLALGQRMAGRLRSLLESLFLRL
ncbi:MAG: purine-nucleoside phosphorylase [Elusimicrobiota bacterium]